MAGKKFLRNVGGLIQEVFGIDSSAGATNAGDLVALDATGRINSNMMPTGIGADTLTVPASEAISAGRLVNIWNNAGTANVRNADASTTGKEAHGFVSAAVASGANATVFFEGTNSSASGMTPGVQFLDPANPGRTTNTAPTTSGGISQQVGIAVSATQLNFQWEPPIGIA